MLMKEIVERRSELVFKEKEVEEEKLSALIDAARWAPSCYNNQPWKFVFVSKKDKTRKEFEEALNLGNSWAKKAAYLVAVSANPKNDCESPAMSYFAYDSGMSVMSLAIQAVHEGLAVHQIAGYNSEKVSSALKIPSEEKLLVVFALGYAEDPKKVWHELDEKIQGRIQMKRMRKPREENFFFEEFNKQK